MKTETILVEKSVKKELEKLCFEESKKDISWFVISVSLCSNGIRKLIDFYKKNIGG